MGTFKTHMDVRSDPLLITATKMKNGKDKLLVNY